MVDGELVLTGGGDLDLKVGGGLNPALTARAMLDDRSRPVAQRHDLNGSLANLRGTVRASAGSFGGIEQVNGPLQLLQDPRESRAYDPFKATMASATGGLVLVPGDATISLGARGDLVLAGRPMPGGPTPAIGSRWISMAARALAAPGSACGPTTRPSTCSPQAATSPLDAGR